MSDFDEKLDALEAELGNRQPASSQPLSIEQYLAQKGAPAMPQNNPQAPVDKSWTDEAAFTPQAPPARAPATMPASSSPTAAPVTMPPPTPSVADYIGSRLSDQTQALKDAQSQSRQNQGIANITEGLGQMTAGLARSSTFNPKAYEHLHQQANQPVEDVQAQQKGKLATLQQMNAENSTNRTAALDDPNSVQSNIARNLAKESLKKYGQDASIVDGMSAGDLKEFLEKPLDQMETRESRETMKKLQLQANALKAQELSDARGEKKTDKAKHDQDQALQNVTATLESARGNPAAAQAERDMYAAQKADSLVKKAGGGDPNNLSPQMVRLLQSEVAKIASGGAPTLEELKGLDVATIPKGLASVMQSLTNEPSAAHAGAFVKQYQDYAHALTEDAQKVIQDKYGRVIETNKDRVGPENYQKLQTNYINRFPKAQPAGETRVNVISPSGKTGSVPQSQLQDALQQGYKQAQ